MLVNPNYAFFKTHKVFTLMDVFYQMLFILGGMNHGFFRYKILPVRVVKVYSFVLCIIFNVGMLSNIVYYDNLLRYSWAFSVIIKYDLYIVHLIFFSKNNSFLNLFEELFVIDSKSGIGASNVEIIVFCSCFGWICLKIVANVIYCFATGWCLPSVRFFCTFIMGTSSDLFILTYAFMFYAIYSRMKQFVIILERTESDFSTQQFMYRLYIDTIEKYKKAFDLTIIIALFCNIPDIMLSAYFTLVEWRYHTMKMDVIALLFQYIFISLSLVITLIPAIFAGMLSFQTKFIKYVLHDKLMQERDERAVYEIQRFIRYVEARGCQFRVYKLIPLDASLVGMVVSFCVTYLIVIIQFTKLY